MHRLFRSGLGIILVYTAIACVILVLQVIPIVGIFMMLFLAALWVGLLIHVAMAHLAIASLSRTISLAWLLVPLTYYAGGYVLHVISVARVNAQIAAIEKANAAARAEIEQPFRFLVEGNADTVELLERYRIDRLFQREGRNPSARFATTSYGKDDACDPRPQSFLLRADLFPSFRGPDKSRQCIVRRYDLPAEWRYRIAADYINGGDFFYTQRGRRWTVSDDRSGAELVRIESGTFEPLLIIPTVFAGCGLNSSKASWDCGAGLMRGSGVPFGYKPRDDRGNPFILSSDPDTWPFAALGRALSLEPRKPTD